MNLPMQQPTQNKKNVMRVAPFKKIFERRPYNNFVSDNFFPRITVLLKEGHVQGAG